SLEDSTIVVFVGLQQYASFLALAGIVFDADEVEPGLVEEPEKSEGRYQNPERYHRSNSSMSLLTIAEARDVFGIDLEGLSIFQLQANLVGRYSQLIPQLLWIDFVFYSTAIITDVLEGAAIGGHAQDQHDRAELAGYQLLHSEASKMS